MGMNMGYVMTDKPDYMLIMIDITGSFHEYACSAAWVSTRTTLMKLCMLGRVGINTDHADEALTVHEYVCRAPWVSTRTTPMKL